jgi:hypothetical protein
MDSAAAAMTPQERLDNGLCCECGISLAGLYVPGHSAGHWPAYILPNGLNDEAIRRQQMLSDYATANPVAIVDPRKAGPGPGQYTSGPHPSMGVTDRMEPAPAPSGPAPKKS